MINHVRTYLRNMPAEWPSEEYVPPEFEHKDEPEIVHKIKMLLWGRTPCSELRIRQMMQMIHATELEEHVLAKDPRVTYLPFGEYAGTTDIDITHFLPDLDELITADDEKELFGDITKEPNATYYNLWKMHDQVQYRMGGLFLAMAEAIEKYHI